MMEASTSKISHWTQGLNKIAQGLIGGYDLRQADQAEKAQGEEAKRLLGGLFDLGADQTPAAVPQAAGAASPPPAASAIPARPSPGASAQVSSLEDRFVNAESGGRSDARAATSSAAGPGQFIDSTWLDIIRKHRPDLIEGRTREQLLAMRTDPVHAGLSKELVGAYSRDNAEILRRAGIDPTDRNLYLAHFFGPGDAVKVIKADPSTPVSAVVSPASVEANVFLKSMTAGRAGRWAEKKVGTSGAAAATPASSTAPAGSSVKERRIQRAVALWGNPQTRPLAQAVLAKHLGENTNPTDLMREYELARSQGYKGNLLDYQKELKQAGKTDSGLTDDLKEYQFAVAQGSFKGSYADWEGMKKAKGLSATEMKAINEAEDAIPVIEGTLANLKAAKALNSKTFTGWGAETGAGIGTSDIPGAGYLADPERAKATREWLDLMRPESIQTMASTLSGATTNFELQEFVKVLSDPSTPRDIRNRTIDRMIRLAEGKERIAKERLQQMRERTYFQPGGGSSNTVKWEKGPDGIPRKVQ
jgi:hypothetical protein